VHKFLLDSSWNLVIPAEFVDSGRNQWGNEKFCGSGQITFHKQTLAKLMLMDLLDFCYIRTATEEKYVQL
jgi:hypothetical protein